MTPHDAALQFAERISYGKTWNVTYTGEHGRDCHGAIEVLHVPTGQTFHVTVELAYEPMTR